MIDSDSTHQGCNAQKLNYPITDTKVYVFNSLTLCDTKRYSLWTGFFHNTLKKRHLYESDRPKSPRFLVYTQ